MTRATSRTLRALMAESLPFSAEELDLLIGTAKYRYKVYKIPKRASKGFRVIAQPTPEVKLLQRWLVAHSLSRLRIHNAATGYRDGMSIRVHADMHARQRFLLKMDFTDFFPSITSEDIRSLLISSRFSEVDAELVCKVVCWNDRRNARTCLSIGAPSSPMLSNAMLYAFDAQIAAAAKRSRVIYSRYADDLAFSTNRANVLTEIRKQVGDVLATLKVPSLTLNEKKTISLSRATQRRLVGLILTNDGTVSLGRERKKILQARMHRYRHGLLEGDDITRLRGELAFAWSVEREFVKRLVGRYGVAVFQALELPFE